MSLDEKYVTLTAHQIEENFVFSMMTIIDETREMAKYDYLNYVEFLEFICRLAICGIKEADLVEYKVYSFLDVVWEKMYESKQFNETDHPLLPVD